MADDKFPAANELDLDEDWKDAPSQVRPWIEMQFAHDMFLLIVSRGDKFNLLISDERDRAAVYSALNVLCWVLGHDHNPSFETNLKRIEECLNEAGIFLERNPPKAQKKETRG
jgi:hypothetical protein